MHAYRIDMDYAAVVRQRGLVESSEQPVRRSHVDLQATHLILVYGLFIHELCTLCCDRDGIPNPSVPRSRCPHALGVRSPLPLPSAIRAPPKLRDGDPLVESQVPAGE